MCTAEDLYSGTDLEYVRGVAYGVGFEPYSVRECEEYQTEGV